MSWDDARYVSFDVESSGRLPEFALQPHRVTMGDSWLTSFVFTNKADGWKTKGYAAQVANDHVTREILAQCLDAAVEKSQTVVGWNIAFDIAWLIAYGFSEQVFKLKWLDGMLLWRHLEIEPEYDTDRGKKRSFSLKEAVRQEFPEHGGYEEDVDFHDMSPEMIATRHTYNKKDTIFSFALTKKYYNRLESQNPQGLRAALLEARCLPLVADAWVRGIEVDVPHTQALVWTLDKDADKALEELTPHGVTQKIVRSPKQLSKLLFEDWGLPVVKQNTSKKTGNTSNSTDKEVLHELSFIDPRAKTLRQYREALNNQTKFPVALLKSVEYNGDGKTRPNARVFGTYTGRMTYDSKQGRNKDERQTGFALHQMKRGSDFRNEIKAPEGYQICEFDAAGQEFRWMAIATGDETMLQLCLPGEDPHGYMGSRIREMDYRAMLAAVAAGDKDAKDGRQLGKVANLSLQYRTSAKKLRSVARVQYNLPMELPEAQRIRNTYLSTYKGVPEYWERQINECFHTKYVETFAGRRVQLRGQDLNSWQVQSTTINYRIQGTGADQKYLALAVLQPYMVKHGIFFAWELHDGLYLYIPDAKIERCVPEIKSILANLPYERAWGFSPPIPLPWDAKVGKRWGDLKEWHN